MQGFKHLVQCHCILPQYRKMKDPVFHKFVVFSTIDKKDNVEPKNVQCNNCGVIHKVFDICKSEIETILLNLGIDYNEFISQMTLVNDIITNMMSLGLNPYMYNKKAI